MKFLKLISFQESRKVAFGLWLFIVACAFLAAKLIVSADWTTCIMLSASLVGGGTIADRYFETKKKDSNADAK